MAVVGDTQRTSVWERGVGRELNDREQGMLIEDLAAQRPSALVIVGDLVFEGSDVSLWAYFDALMAPLRAGGAAFFPVMGNHDYQGSDRAALTQMRGRFAPLAGASYYAFDWGTVRMIAVDANHDVLGTDGWARQLTWLRAELAALDAGPLRGAIVFLHQAPFTQSPWVEGDRFVLGDIVPLVCGSTRTLALISGHAHGYERFVRGPAEGCGARPRFFVVSAGGGGPRPPKRRTGARVDASPLPWPRPFHYLLLSQTPDAVDVVMRGIDKGGTRVAPIDEESQHWPFAGP